MTPIVDLSFSHLWQAEVLAARPLILPPRSFVYPRQAEEVERGALEVLVRPPGAQPFLATCALGFRDPAVSTGIWSSPKPEEICAVAGGYAYLIDTAEPERFTMISYRPVLEVRAVPAEGLLLFVGHRSILAWGCAGQAWESERLSDEGVTISKIENGILHGTGWEMRSDRGNTVCAGIKHRIEAQVKLESQFQTLKSRLRAGSIVSYPAYTPSNTESQLAVSA